MSKKFRFADFLSAIWLLFTVFFGIFNVAFSGLGALPITVLLFGMPSLVWIGYSLWQTTNPAKRISPVIRALLIIIGLLPVWVLAGPFLLTLFLQLLDSSGLVPDALLLF